jgi:hypothetical protein
VCVGGFVPQILCCYVQGGLQESHGSCMNGFSCSVNPALCFKDPFIPFGCCCGCHRQAVKYCVGACTSFVCMYSFSGRNWLVHVIACMLHDTSVGGRRNVCSCLPLLPDVLQYPIRSSVQATMQAICQETTVDSILCCRALISGFLRTATSLQTSGEYLETNWPAILFQYVGRLCSSWFCSDITCVCLKQNDAGLVSRSI